MPKDEAYILALCDQALGSNGIRQHRFDFLRGDPGKRGVCRKLPVDAYYPDLRIVIEYRERQHSESVAIMDRRMTVSGCSRGEQRRRYDERRRVVLRENRIQLIELNYRMFKHDRRKRLLRDPATDLSVVAFALGRRYVRHNKPTLDEMVLDHRAGKSTFETKNPAKEGSGQSRPVQVAVRMPTRNPRAAPSSDR